MKKAFFVFCLLIAAVLFSGCDEQPKAGWKEEFVQCTADEDCKIVQGYGCCGCDIAINKNQETQYDEFDAANPCKYDDVQCAGCRSSNNAKAICENSKCQIKWPERITLSFPRGDFAYFPVEQDCANAMQQYIEGSEFIEKGFSKCELVSSRESFKEEECTEGMSIAGCAICSLECS